MLKYNTKQREALLSFLQKHTDELLSTAQIADGVKKYNISLSAVYRNISSLEAEGKLLRHIKGGSREAFYQYVSAEKCGHKLHLSCKKCGKISHLGSESTKKLISQIAGSEKFSVDGNETVLYGICAECKNK